MLQRNSKGQGLMGMNIWQWFCQLGTHNFNNGWLPFEARQTGYRAGSPDDKTGVTSVCTRLCGYPGCRCGSTIRGLHCIWSHYRLER